MNKKLKKVLDFGKVPSEIKELKSYYEYKELCSLYYNVYQTTNYGFWHMNGQMNLYLKDSEALKGTFGLVFEPAKEVTNYKQKKRNALL